MVIDREAVLVQAGLLDIVDQGKEQDGLMGGVDAQFEGARRRWWSIKWKLSHKFINYFPYFND